MANDTTQFKRTVAGTINSGMRSVFGGEGRRYFVIEHKDDSPLHRRGEQQKMIVDEVFIGRDNKCQVLIDEQFGMVSREHAVIVRSGDQWKLIHRSQTNDTLVNGQRVMGEQVLQNGDEIQLSYNGPRLGFIIPQGDQSLVKSIGMTARLNLFRQQALRPYKKALTLMTVFFCLAIAGLIAGLLLLNKENKQLSLKNGIFAKRLDSLALAGPDTVYNEKTVYVHGGGGGAKGMSIATPGEMTAFEPYVYFVNMTSITIDAPKNSELHDYFNLPVTKTFVGSDIPIATGFITSNGYLITARHVVEPWAYKVTNSLDNFFTCANILYNLGAVIDAEIVAESKTGDHRVFHYSDFSVSDRSGDVKKVIVDDEGDTYEVYQATRADDYAYKKVNASSNIVMNPSLAKNLPAGARLEILGFPGQGYDKNAIRPQYTYATTSNSGLLHNLIPVTGANLEPGNSGGPVFYKDGKNYYVIGIVSSRYGRSSGQIVPISAISF